MPSHSDTLDSTTDVPLSSQVLVQAFDEIAESNVMFASSESSPVGNDDAKVSALSSLGSSYTIREVDEACKCHPDFDA
jgi:hypothetical protein